MASARPRRVAAPSVHEFNNIFRLRASGDENEDHGFEENAIDEASDDEENTEDEESRPNMDDSESDEDMTEAERPN